MNIIKNILLTLFFIGVIIGSFWVSFNIGKVILVPVKKSPSVEMITRESPTTPPVHDNKSSDPTGKISFEVENVPIETSTITDEDYDVQTVKKEKTAAKSKPKMVSRKDAACGIRVQSGLFALAANAQSLAKKIRNLGLNAQVEITGKYKKVYVSARNLPEARLTASKLRSAGFEAIIR